MRKIITILTALCALALGISSAEQAQASPVVAQTGANGFAMGSYPNYWTICVANGYGPTAGLVENWGNWPGRRLVVNALNRCTGYSITNRMTIEAENAPGGACISYTNTHKTWSPARGKYIWDQNPIVWINTAPGCFDNNTELYHNIQKGVGYVLGIGYNPNGCLCVMGSDSFDTNNIPYVVNADSLDASVIYG